MSGIIEKNINIVYKTYVHDLFSYALGLGFDRETSMDAIHDVFFKICLDTEIMNDVNNIRFYLLRSLKNRLLDICKQKRNKVEVLLDTNLINELPFVTDVTIEEQVIRTEEDEALRRKVDSLLKELTDRQREIIYLRYSLNCDYDEIAGLMGITVPGCRKLFHKAIMKLREVSA